ncbi:hypothetical protein JOD24_003186 [Kroppenstedtia sanguinis]
MPIAKPVKGGKMALKYGDKALTAGKNNLDKLTRKGKKTACGCPKKGGGKNNPGKKTSVTFGQPIDIVYQGKKGKLRVDAEPDGNKVQIQMGKGKRSDIDIRIDPDLPVESQIPKNIKKAVGKGKIEDLTKNIERYVNYVKEHR